MIILYDFELQSSEEFIFQPKGMILLAEVKEMIYRRIKPLENQIELYPKARIIINFFGLYHDEIGIHYVDYPDELAEKMSDCLSKQDFRNVFDKWTAWYDNEQ